MSPSSGRHQRGRGLSGRDVCRGLDPLPYSIAPLPDGRIRVTEKTRGLRIVSPGGEISESIRGTPEVFDDGVEVPGIQLVYGTGYLLGVAPHRFQEGLVISGQPSDVLSLRHSQRIQEVAWRDLVSN